MLTTETLSMNTFALLPPPVRALNSKDIPPPTSLPTLKVNSKDFHTFGSVSKDSGPPPSMTFDAPPPENSEKNSAKSFHLVERGESVIS